MLKVSVVTGRCKSILDELNRKYVDPQITFIVYQLLGVIEQLDENRRKK